MFYFMRILSIERACVTLVFMIGFAFSISAVAIAAGNGAADHDKTAPTKDFFPKAKPAVPYHKTIKKQPETPKERRKVLSNLYAHLATAPDRQTAQEIAQTIESLWQHSNSDTISVLLGRANTAIVLKELGVARELLDAAVELAPDFAEAWNRRALVYYMQNDYARALGDLRRAIALEPNHFKAMDGLGRILNDVGQKKGALETFRMLKKIHPFWENSDELIKELELEVDGRGI